MFCPTCGTLAYPNSDGIIYCKEEQCQYIGLATNPSILVRSEKDQFERVNGSNDAWNEPSPRLQPIISQVCQVCGSNEVNIVGNDLECKKCGADVN